MNTLHFDASRVTSIAVAALIPVLHACGDSGIEPETAGTPASLTVVDGDKQDGVVGTALPVQLVVRVADNKDRPVPGASVSWTAAEGGSVVMVSAQTDRNGLARASWTLGERAGAQTASATVANLPAISFSATARAGAPATVEKQAGDGQSAPVASTLAIRPAVRVTDRFNNPVSGVPVLWSVETGRGTVTPEVTLTDDAGRAAVDWMLGVAAGANRVTASVPGLAAVSFNANATPGPATRITLNTLAATIKWGEMLRLTATVRDAFGNDVPKPVTWVSSNVNVATVSSSGEVRGLRAGLVTVVASVDGVSASITINVSAATMTVSVVNQLWASARVFLNGAELGVVRAGEDADFEIATPTSVELSWRAIPPMTVGTNPQPLGLAIGGVFPVVEPAPVRVYDIDNVIGSSVYFAPSITNNLSFPLLLGVNFGTPSENRCNCQVGPGRSGWIGYHPMIAGSNVRGFQSSYSGEASYAWTNLTAAMLEPYTGVLHLTANAPGAPAAAALPSADLPLIPLPVQRPSSPRRSDHGARSDDFERAAPAGPAASPRKRL